MKKCFTVVVSRTRSHYRLTPVILVAVSLICSWSSAGASHSRPTRQNECTFVELPPSTISVFYQKPFTITTVVTSECVAVNAHPCDDDGLFTQYLSLEDITGTHTRRATYSANVSENAQCIRFAAIAGIPVYSDDILIYAQGRLGPVTNVSYALVNRKTLHLTWTQPPSLPNLSFEIMVKLDGHQPSNTTNNSVVMELNEAGWLNITILPFNEIGEGESVTELICIPESPHLKTADAFPYVCNGTSVCVAISLLLSPETCPGANLSINVNIFDAGSGTIIGYWNNTVSHTTNISISEMGSPNKITVPRERHVIINVVVKNAMGSALPWNYSMSSYTTQEASLNISRTDICIRCSFLRSSSMSGCGIRFYDIPGPLNRQMITKIRAMQKKDTHTDTAIACVGLAKVKNSTYLEVYDISRDGKFSKHPAKTFKINSTYSQVGTNTSNSTTMATEEQSTSHFLPWIAVVVVTAVLAALILVAVIIILKLRSIQTTSGESKPNPTGITSMHTRLVEVFRSLIGVCRKSEEDQESSPQTLSVKRLDTSSTQEAKPEQNQRRLSQLVFQLPDKSSDEPQPPPSCKGGPSTSFSSKKRRIRSLPSFPIPQDNPDDKGPAPLTPSFPSPKSPTTWSISSHIIYNRSCDNFLKEKINKATEMLLPSSPTKKKATIENNKFE